MNLSTFPIRILAERTGVPPSTIRAWERRYGILQAQRTACGHRHYTDDDVALIKRLQQRIARGATISKAIRELDALQHVINGVNHQEQSVNSQQWQHMVMELLEAINNFDTYKLDETYQEALSLYSVDVVTEKILRPTLVALGKRWPNGATSVAEEHFFSTYLRNKIGARIHHSAQSTGPTLVIACVPGEHHELGSLLFALSAKNAGYRLLLLGADLPLDQITPVVNKVQAAGVVLSMVNSRPDAKFVKQLDELAQTLDIPIMLGGINDVDVAFESVHLLGSDFSKAINELVDLIPLY